MNNWQTIEDETSEAIDAAFAERVRVVPMRPGSQYAPPAPDATRGPFETNMVVAQPGAVSNVNLAGHTGSTWNVRIGVGAIEAHVDTRAFPHPMELRQGDVLELLDRGGARFEIAQIDDRTRGRRLLVLNRI